MWTRARCASTAESESPIASPRARRSLSQDRACSTSPRSSVISPSRNRTAGSEPRKGSESAGQDSPGSRLGLVQGAHDEVELDLGDEAEGVDVRGLLEASSAAPAQGSAELLRRRRGRGGHWASTWRARRSCALLAPPAASSSACSAKARPDRRGRCGRRRSRRCGPRAIARPATHGRSGAARRSRAQTFVMMGAGSPHVVQVARQPQARRRPPRVRRRRPVEGDAQVAELAQQLVEGDDPGLVLTVVERPGEAGVVVKVPSSAGRRVRRLRRATRRRTDGSARAAGSGPGWPSTSATTNDVRTSSSRTSSAAASSSTHTAANAGRSQPPANTLIARSAVWPAGDNRSIAPGEGSPQRAVTGQTRRGREAPTR